MDYLKEVTGNAAIAFVKFVFILGRVIEMICIGGAVLALFYVGGFPTYRTAVVSLEHWPKAFLGGIMIMVLLGFVLRKVNNERLYNTVLYGATGICAVLFGVTIINDLGDALVLYEDIHTSPVISGWVALIIVTAVISVYYGWLYKKARKISRHYR